MKGIILAGGSGTRLYPITKGVSKQLLSVYDKPMIYYPLSVLMLAGISEILIISTPDDIDNFKKLLSDGNNIGLRIQYKVQPKPEGLAQAFILGANFIGNDNVCLILGDNIFYGSGLTNLLAKSVETTRNKNKACIFGYYVSNPTSFGVVEMDDKNNAISIEEKPKNPKSNYAVTGLYFYPNEVIKIANKIKPSERGELEISSVNNFFLNNKKLKVNLLGRGFTWLDTGTYKSLLKASNFIKIIQEHSGFKIACLEEIAYTKGYISKEKLEHNISLLGNSDYGKYLKKLIV